VAIEGEILEDGLGGSLGRKAGEFWEEREEFFGRGAQSFVVSFTDFSSAALETRKELAPEFEKNRIK